jgi:hypothetical protein
MYGADANGWEQSSVDGIFFKYGHESLCFIKVEGQFRREDLKSLKKDSASQSTESETGIPPNELFICLKLSAEIQRVYN